ARCKRDFSRLNTCISWSQEICSLHPIAHRIVPVSTRSIRPITRGNSSCARWCRSRFTDESRVNVTVTLISSRNSSHQRRARHTR
ncbi:hypothetical protein SERLADRAFT_459413, partial [Serpula lacrymans var. lacrymans S7.9]